MGHLEHVAVRERRPFRAFGQITAILPEALDGKGIVVAIQNPEDGDFERVKLAFNERVLNRL